MTESDVRTGDGEFVRELNRFHVLDCIRRFEPVSRIEIVDRSGLSRGTVSAIVGELLDEGLVHEAPRSIWARAIRRERRALRAG